MQDNKMKARQQGVSAVIPAFNEADHIGGVLSVTIGLFDQGRWQTDLTHRLFPFLSGQRCLRWPLFRDLYDGSSSGWSFETALNLHRRFHHLRHEQVPLPGVTHVTRAEKKRRVWPATGLMSGCGLK
jgi:hypothetical protein